MTDIFGYWIFSSDGNLLFSLEQYFQGSGDVDSALLAGLISAIQNFILELGERSAEAIELGNSKLFLSKEEDLVFVLKADPKVKDKKMTKLLEKSKDNFMKNYKKHLSAEAHLRIHIFSAFNKDLLNLFGLHKGVKDKSGKVTAKSMTEFFNSL